METLHAPYRDSAFLHALERTSSESFDASDASRRKRGRGDNEQSDEEAYLRTILQRMTATDTARTFWVYTHEFLYISLSGSTKESNAYYEKVKEHVVDFRVLLHACEMAFRRGDYAHLDFVMSGDMQRLLVSTYNTLLKFNLSY